jgi:hypothetical protein
MKATLGAFAALFVFVGSALSNGVPVRTRSNYGQTGSPQQGSTLTSTVDGITFTSQEFCSDASISTGDPATDTIGTCQVLFAFQITSTLPANGQSLTFTFPIPVNGSVATLGFGLLTSNDGSDTITDPTIPSSPFSSSDVNNLPPNAIQFGGGGGLGNPFLTFALPINLTGGGADLAMFMEVSNNNSNDHSYCYKLTDTCAAIDIPSIPTLGVELKTSTVGTPEPASLALLASGLLGLGLVRRKRATN